MARIIRCPSCGRTYSIEEYEEDRFCRDCGTLLVHREMAEGGNGTWRRIFPYAPYPEQEEFMGDVERIVGGGGVLISEACNGFGKTASALSSLLALRRSIVYATRTHEQVRQVLAEVSAMNEKAEERFTAVNLASREHLCLNPECRDLPHRESIEVCRALVEEGGCPYGSDIPQLPRGLAPVLDPGKLMEAGRRAGLCPYFLARRAAKQSMVVVVPYVYVFDAHIRASVGLELSGKVLVLDEGHNLDRIGQEALSDTLSSNSLESAANELRSIGKPTRHMKRLIEHLREHVSETPELSLGEALDRELELALGIDLDGFVDQYEGAVEAVRRRKMSLGELPISHLNGVLSFVSLVASSVKDRYIGIYQRNQYGADALEYRCLDPSLAITPLIDGARGSLIMSGTLSPMELFAEIIGLSRAEKRAYPPIQSAERIRMVIDATVTTRFDERSDEMIMRIGRGIASELPSIPNGVLMFFTQRPFMSKCLDTWNAGGLVDVHRNMLHIGGKPLYVEGRDARENQEVVERYKRAAVSPEGAALCCVFRGRNSEGSNFPDEQARGIFLVGVPYANYADPIVRAQIAHFNRRGEGLGNRWYLMDAFRAANQAMGRGVRGRDDWCHYWLLDARYADHVDLLSRWALGPGPEIRKEPPLD
jgi:Rad3-related DNA helicase